MAWGLHGVPGTCAPRVKPFRIGAASDVSTPYLRLLFNLGVHELALPLRQQNIKRARHNPYMTAPVCRLALSRRTRHLRKFKTCCRRSARQHSRACKPAPPSPRSAGQRWVSSTCHCCLHRCRPRPQLPTTHCNTNRCTHRCKSDTRHSHSQALRTRQAHTPRLPRGRAKSLTFATASSLPPQCGGNAAAPSVIA